MGEKYDNEPAKKKLGLFRRKRNLLHFFISMVPLGMAWKFSCDYTLHQHCDRFGKETIMVLEEKYTSGKLNWKTFDFTFNRKKYSCFVNDDKYAKASNGDNVTLKYSERDDCFCDVEPVDKLELLGAVFFALLGLILLADSLFPFFPSSLEGEKDTR